MKRVIGLSLVAILSLTLITGCQKKEEDKTPKGNTGNIAEDLENKTDTKQGDLTFSDIEISAIGATNKITGKVKNTGEKKSYNLDVYMYNKQSGRMLGTASTTVTDLDKNKTIDFEIGVIGDYSTVDEFKVVATELK